MLVTRARYEAMERRAVEAEARAERADGRADHWGRKYCELVQQMTEGRSFRERPMPPPRPIETPPPDEPTSLSPELRALCAEFSFGDPKEEAANLAIATQLAARRMEPAEIGAVIRRGAALSDLDETDDA